MEGGNRFQMPSPVSSSGERFPVVRTGVPPLQGSTLTGSNAGSCDREAAFCSKRSGNAEFICLRLLFPERDKDEGFFCCSDRKRIRAVRYSPRPNIFYPPAEKLRAGRPRTTMLSILTKERILSHEHTCNRFNRSRMPCSRLSAIWPLARKQMGHRPCCQNTRPGPRGRAGLRSDKRLYRLLSPVFIHRRRRPCHRCNSGRCIRLAPGSSVGTSWRHLLRCCY